MCSVMSHNNASIQSGLKLDSGLEFGICTGSEVKWTSSDFTINGKKVQTLPETVVVSDPKQSHVRYRVEAEGSEKWCWICVWMQSEMTQMRLSESVCISCTHCIAMSPWHLQCLLVIVISLLPYLRPPTCMYSRCSNIDLCTLCLLDSILLTLPTRA